MGNLTINGITALSIADSYDQMYGTLHLWYQPRNKRFSLCERIFAAVEVEWRTLVTELTAEDCSLLIKHPKVHARDDVIKHIEEQMGHYDDCREYDRQNPRSQQVLKKDTPKMSAAEQTILGWFDLTKEERSAAARSLLEQGYLELDDRLQLKVSKKRDASR